MHSALFVTFQQVGEKGNLQWTKFVGQTDPKTAQDKGVLRLAETVWLVNLNVSVGSLGHLIAAAENEKLPYGILPFDAEPRWLPDGFDPKTIQGRSA